MLIILGELMAMKFQPIQSPADWIAQGSVCARYKRGRSQTGITQFRRGGSEAVGMNTATEAVISIFKVGNIDLEKPRQFQRRKQVEVSGEWSSTLRTYKARFLLPRA